MAGSGWERNAAAVAALPNFQTEQCPFEGEGHRGKFCTRKGGAELFCTPRVAPDFLRCDN